MNAPVSSPQFVTFAPPIRQISLLKLDVTVSSGATRMQLEIGNWKRWHDFFANRSSRQLPGLLSSDDYRDIPDSVAKSLAIFQLGESGGGTVIEQARTSTIQTVHEHYAAAMKLFVAEEHRHAELLAIAVRNLGGSLVAENWTAKLFVVARRLMGLRLKVMVLLAAEVVGLCYYQLIASRLPHSRLRSILAQIVNDQRAHLSFHCSFLRTQVQSRWRRNLFRFTWKMTMFAACIVVAVDHRRALRDLDITAKTVIQRWNSYSNFAERLVTDSGNCVEPVLLEAEPDSQTLQKPSHTEPSFAGRISA